ncbi:hypothetical protein EDB81DRAFT_952907 [Dactylonectria macrodidyma]|uniref:Uncharacterized protein n=1 Tax=Dactylonectria macrodidyma TaxID=307937 RepID=A0A9P9DEI6_9HYPO|nr:hypothetical protein EDB81DRAFT_952907 [Dactylonectria macrodidyma]
MDKLIGAENSTMANSPTIHSTFSVTSGHLCFGSLHNIWQGASAPLQGFPTARPQTSGTVIIHRIDHNVPALNGTWNVFQLVGSESNDTAAWFVAQSDVDPKEEIDKILRVSGSPYEADHGSTMNNDDTSQAGIFVINRYDWGYYDRRFYDEIGEGEEEGKNDGLANSNSLGLVDHSDAQEMVHQWKEQRPSERGRANHGIWLYIPRGEYMFGRFGFDDTHTAARSFLFFSMYTEFTRTSFKGASGTLRRPETPQERFERRLSEGVDFSGIETIYDMLSDRGVLPGPAPPPPASERLGPYDSSDYILREQDIDALRLYLYEPEEHFIQNGIDFTAARLNKPVYGFVDPWKQPLLDLLNEMTLSYLEHFVLPHLCGDNITAIAEALFPNHNGDFYRHFTQPDKSPVQDFDMSYVSSRIRGFLESQSQDKSRVFEDKAVRGICRVAAYILTEVFEMANNAAIDERRDKILPCDIRIVVLLDWEILRLVSFSKVFWEGKV